MPFPTITAYIRFDLDPVPLDSDVSWIRNAVDCRVRQYKKRIPRNIEVTHRRQVLSSNSEIRREGEEWVVIPFILGAEGYEKLEPQKVEEFEVYVY